MILSQKIIIGFSKFCLISWFLKLFFILNVLQGVFIEFFTEASIWPIRPEDWLLYSYSDLSNKS